MHITEITNNSAELQKLETGEIEQNLSCYQELKNQQFKTIEIKTVKLIIKDFWGGKIKTSTFSFFQSNTFFKICFFLHKKLQFRHYEREIFLLHILCMINKVLHMWILIKTSRGRLAVCVYISISQQTDFNFWHRTLYVFGELGRYAPQRSISSI